MFDKLDLAYAAGYIDGDGCFHIRKQPVKNHLKFRGQLIISSTNEDTILWFQKTFEGAIRKQTIVCDTHKLQFHFVLTTQHLEKINQIRPFLVEKKDEANLFYKFVTEKSKNLKSDFIAEMKILKFSSNLIKEDCKKEVESLKNTILPSIEDIAYLAGFIDAECCLNIQKYKEARRPNYLYKPQLQCNNSKLPVFKWILSRFGGQVHFIDRSHYKSPHRNQLTWRLSSRALSFLLKKIFPFLKNKKLVCKELIDYFEINLPNGGDRQSEKFKTFYAEILAKKEAIFQRVQILNKKGI